ncbi:MAG: hypothetical protein CR986_07645 [Ignavibacteriae bacterium]|nr:MAG: hypothetical protein CR986_07645 [Ignavibacteriota bacterium]
MGITSKYDFFMDELNSLEKIVQKFVRDNEELFRQKSELEKKITKLEKENEVLIFKISDLEKKLNKAGDEIKASAKSKMNLSDRNYLINQIDDFIEKLEFHIKS